MGNVSDNEIVARMRRREESARDARDAEVEKHGFVRVTTAMDPAFPWREPKGWKLHLVEASPDTPLADLRYCRPLCGVRPAHGYDLDMFIADECARCTKAYAKRITNQKEGAQ